MLLEYNYTKETIIQNAENRTVQRLKTGFRFKLPTTGILIACLTGFPSTVGKQGNLPTAPKSNAVITEPRPVTARKNESVRRLKSSCKTKCKKL